MTTNRHDNQEAGGSDVDSVEPRGLDPRSTDNPTGSKQAAENAANDPRASSAAR
jgi:hypothetical protein